MFSTFLCLQDTAKRSPQWMRMMLLDIKPCLCQFSPHCHHRETKMTGTLSHNSKPLGQSVWGRVGKVVPERALLLQTRLWQEERCCGIPPHAIWEWGDKVTANSRRACGSAPRRCQKASHWEPQIYSAVGGDSVPHQLKNTEPFFWWERHLEV